MDNNIYIFSIMTSYPCTPPPVCCRRSNKWTCSTKGPSLFPAREGFLGVNKPPISFNFGTPINNEIVTPEMQTIGSDIKMMESNVKALKIRLLKKRKEQRELIIENRKKKMGTINSLESSLGGLHLMGVEQRDLFTSILYILKDFDSRLGKIELKDFDKRLGKIELKDSVDRKKIEHPSTPEELYYCLSNKHTYQNYAENYPCGCPTDEVTESSDKNLFARLKALEQQEESSEVLKQTKITEFIKRFPPPTNINEYESCEEEEGACDDDMPGLEPITPPRVSPRNEWDDDDDWNDDSCSFNEFDKTDTRIKDQPDYIATYNNETSNDFPTTFPSVD